MKSYVVIGLGLFGARVARQLAAEGQNVLAIDLKEDRIERIADSVTRAVTADASKRDILLELGVNKYDCAIVAMTGELAASVLITMNLKALGVPEIICKAQDDTDKEVLETLGATTVVVPEHLAADKLSRKLVAKNLVDYTELSNEYSIVEINTPKTWAGKSVAAMNIRAEYGINIIALKHKGTLIVSFDPQKPLSEDDVLVIIGNNRTLDKIQSLH